MLEVWKNVLLLPTPSGHAAHERQTGSGARASATALRDMAQGSTWGERAALDLALGVRGLRGIYTFGNENGSNVYPDYS